VKRGSPTCRPDPAGVSTLVALTSRVYFPRAGCAQGRGRVNGTGSWADPEDQVLASEYELLGDDPPGDDPGADPA